MAVDATGTPTTLGIPKYNTAADAPSGKGFDATMDALDTLIAARMLAPASPASGDIVIWNGSAWVKQSLFPGNPTGVYQNYTFALGATGGGTPGIGNASGVISRYVQTGKTVHYYGTFTQGTTTNYGTGTLLISVPVTAANITPVGCGQIFHAGTLAQYLVMPGLANSGQLQLIIPNGYGGGSAAVSGSAGYPWAWATGDVIQWTITYEAA